MKSKSCRLQKHKVTLNEFFLSVCLNPPFPFVSTNLRFVFVAAGCYIYPPQSFSVIFTSTSLCVLMLRKDES